MVMNTGSKNLRHSLRRPAQSHCRGALDCKNSGALSIALEYLSPQVHILEERRQ